MPVEVVQNCMCGTEVGVGKAIKGCNLVEKEEIVYTFH